MSVTQPTIEQTRDACVESFATYARLMQDDGYFDPTHEKLCMWTQAHIERMERQLEVTGKCTGKLCYVMPRGSLKSTIVTKHLNTWLVIRRFYKFQDDTVRILLAGNTHTNSKKKLQGIRGVFDTTVLFQTLFPDMLPKKGREGNKWSDESACINRKSSFDESTFEIGSLKTKLTGRHYNVICEDDTTAPDSSEMEDGLTRPSVDTIQQAIGFHQAGISLFVPKGFTLSIIVSTRWAVEDLVSYVQDEESYNVFDVPASVNGKPTFECFYDDVALAEIEKRIGSYMFSCLYLNKPIDDSLRVFKSTDMQWIDFQDVPKAGSISIAVDPAISKNDDACESAITAMLHHTNEQEEMHEYWLEARAGKFDPHELAEHILRMADKYDTKETPVTSIIIETIAYQEALKYILINLLNVRKGKGQKVYTLVKAARGNKGVRIEGMQPQFQQKRIWFVRGNLSDQTESQLLQYPGGRLVDVIDSWSMHRKVWRSENHKLPAKPKAPISDWDQVLNQIKHKNAKKRVGISRGLGMSSVTHLGSGL